MIEAALIRGAKKAKRGPAAKADILVESNAPLEYDGPRDPKALWENERFRLRVPVKIGTSKVMRTRPRFRRLERQYRGQVFSSTPQCQGDQDFSDHSR